MALSLRVPWGHISRAPGIPNCLHDTYAPARSARPGRYNNWSWLGKGSLFPEYFALVRFGLLGLHVSQMGPQPKLLTANEIGHRAVFVVGDYGLNRTTGVGLVLIDEGFQLTLPG